MKKLSVIVLLIVALFSCAKKITSTPIIIKENETDASKIDSTLLVAPFKTDKAEFSNTITVDVSKVSEKELSKLGSVNISDALSGKIEKPKENLIISEGKEIYEVKCSRCHEFKSPSNYNAEKWIKIVDWMGPRAKIGAVEKESILAYVSFYAKK